MSLLFIGSWGFAILEFILVQISFIPIFSLGLSIYVEDYDFDSSHDNFNIPQNITRFGSEGKFRFSNNGQIFFATQLSVFTLIRINTPFPLKGIATITNDSTLKVKGRIPLGTSIFFGCFIIAWLFFGLTDVVSGNIDSGLTILVIGFLVFSFILFISYKIEVARFEMMVFELCEIMRKKNRV